MGFGKILGAVGGAIVNGLIKEGRKMQESNQRVARYSDNRLHDLAYGFERGQTYDKGAARRELKRRGYNLPDPWDSSWRDYDNRD